MKRARCLGVMLAVAGLAGVGLSRSASAYPNQPISVDLDLGTTTFTGDLAKSTAVSTYGLSIGVGFARSAENDFTRAVGGFGGFFAIDFVNMSGKTLSDPKFPFTASRSFNASTASLSPNICVLANSPVQVCLGLGWEHFEVAQGSDNDQTYGSYLYTLSVGRWLDEGLHAGLKTSYRSFSQKINGNSSSVEALSLLAAIGWEFAASRE